VSSGIEIRITDLKTRLQCQGSTGPYDTGAPRALLGKPVLVKLYAGGVLGYGQIRPLHHVMPGTYASMISMIKDVCGARLIGQSICDGETIHGLLDRIAVPIIRRTVKRFLFGCTKRDARMPRLPRMRSPDCGHSSTASSW
jgi:hypothetical protein